MKEKEKVAPRRLVKSIYLIRLIDYSSNPSAPPSDKNGPVNTFHFNRNLLNASATDVVSPNADTLYGVLYLDLKNQPLVMKVPAIADRYFVIQFLDAYDNVPLNIGTRTNVTSGETYLTTGPGWSGTVPNGMIQINLPTNRNFGASRVLVNGSDDVANARELYNKFSISPLSLFESKNNQSSDVAATSNVTSNASKVVPSITTTISYSYYWDKYI